MANLDATTASGTWPTTFSKDTKTSAYSVGVAVKRKCIANECTDHHDSRLTGCLGNFTQLSTSEELNQRIKTAMVPWLLFPGPRGQQFLAAFGISIFDIKHATDDMIGKILRGQAYRLYRASTECDAFAVAVVGIEKYAMSLLEVATMVGGLTGFTQEQRVLLAEHLLSRMTILPPMPTTFAGKRVVEKIINDVRHIGVTAEAVDLSCIRTPDG